MSQVVRVNPSSMQQYASQANQQFADARQALSDLVRETAEVHYFGPNADRFKHDCSTLAAELANKLLRQFQTIAEAVAGSTSNIAASLGGSPIRITVDASPLSPPAIAASPDVVDVDTSALSSLSSFSNSAIGRVKEALQAHLSALQGTDWVGDAKNQAVDIVGNATRTAQAASDDAQQQISNFITKQIDAVRQADR